MTRSKPPRFQRPAPARPINPEPDCFTQRRTIDERQPVRDTLLAARYGCPSRKGPAPRRDTSRVRDRQWQYVDRRRLEAALAPHGVLSGTQVMSAAKRHRQISAPLARLRLQAAMSVDESAAAGLACYTDGYFAVMTNSNAAERGDRPLRRLATELGIVEPADLTAPAQERSRERRWQVRLLPLFLAAMSVAWWVSYSARRSGSALLLAIAFSAVLALALVRNSYAWFTGRDR